MEYRNLGRSGLKVSRICLGTMTFGRWIDEEASARVLDAALEAGINFIDTADFYGRGQDTGEYSQRSESEAILGRLLKGRRTARWPGACSRASTGLRSWKAGIPSAAGPPLGSSSSTGSSPGPTSASSRR